PTDDTLLFVTVETLAGNVLKKVNGHVPFSVWTVGSDGRNLHKVVDALARTEDDLAEKNFVTWGPLPDTVIYTDFRNGWAAAIMLDLKNRESTDILPAPANGYELEFSPSRSQGALLAYHEKSKSADLYISDFTGSLNWKQIDTIRNIETADNETQPIHW